MCVEPYLSSYRSSAARSITFSTPSASFATTAFSSDRSYRSECGHGWNRDEYQCRLRSRFDFSAPGLSPASADPASATNARRSFAGFSSPPSASEPSLSRMEPSPTDWIALSLVKATSSAASARTASLLAMTVPSVSDCTRSSAPADAAGGGEARGGTTRTSDGPRAVGGSGGGGGGARSSRSAYARRSRFEAPPRGQSCLKSW